jgi:signal peptidase I
MELIRFIFVVLLIVVPIRAFVAQPFIVSGHSMDPTFADGEYLIVDEITYRFDEPERGDIIVFRPPTDKSKFYIKRIIGLPGEKVEVNDGIVTIFKNENDDGIVLDEPYILKKSSDTDKIWELGADDYFVMGDNRTESSDSRSWGTLDGGAIVGRAFIRLLPLQEIKLKPGEYDYSEI